MPTKTWIATTNTTWNTAGNWSPSGVPTSTDDVIFNSSANGNCSLATTAGTCKSLVMTGYSGIFGFSTTLTITDSTDSTSNGNSLVLSSTATYSGFSTLTFTGTAGGKITSNGKTFTNPISINSVGGTFTFTDAFSSNTSIAITNAIAVNFNSTVSVTAITQTTGTVTVGGSITTSIASYTLASGTLNLGSYTHNFFSFSSSNGNTRTINFGTCAINLTGNGTTIWTTATATNLTFLGTPPTINCTYAGSTGTRSIGTGSLTEANALSFNILAGTDTVNHVGSTTTFKNLDFTGFTGTYVTGINQVRNFYGNVTLGAGMTCGGSPGTFAFVFLASSGTQTFTSNGVTFNNYITVNSAGTTLNIADAFSGVWMNVTAGTITTNGTVSLSSTSFGALTVNGGTLTINANFSVAGQVVHSAGTITVNNNANVTCPIYGSNYTNVRALNMGGGTWTLTGTGTVWNAGVTGSNMTLNAQQSTILITDTSATAVTFGGGGYTYNILQYARGGGGGSLTFAGSSTYNNFIDNTSTVAHSIFFTATTTQTFNAFNVRGTAGNLITIDSTTTATHALVNNSGGFIKCDYLNIQHSVATPSGTWFAGTNSVNNQSVANAGSGWVFTNGISLLGSCGVG